MNIAMAGSTQACTAVPEEVSSIFKARILEKHKQSELRRQEVAAQAAASRALSDAARGQKRKATVQRSMFDHVESTTRQDCDEKIAAFFYRCDLPFAAVDSAAFKDLVATLKNHYIKGIGVFRDTQNSEINLLAGKCI